jgi:hypothetical protein
MLKTLLLLVALRAVVDAYAQPGLGFEVIRRDPEQDLLLRVESIVGPEPQDCGRLMQPGTWGRPAYNLDDVAEPVRCATVAAGERRPSVVVLKTMGFDSWTAMGLLTNASGRLWFFTYDNLHGHGTLRTSSCSSPTAKVTADGFPHVECAKEQANHRR